jgi:hypothetical protein
LSRSVSCARSLVTESRLTRARALPAPLLQYHWLSEQGTKRFTHDEAIRQSGENPDFAKQDLFEHLEKGGTAEYTMMVQVRPAPVHRAAPLLADLDPLTSLS